MIDHETLRRAARAWAGAWSAPIDGPCPTGDDCRFDDMYDAVDIELGKAGGLSREAPDWELVEHRASDLLRRRTRDLRLHTALCLALVNTRGYWGLAAGLSACRAVVERWWDSVHPRRKRARVSALARLAHRLGSRTAADFCLLDVHPPLPWEGPALALCVEALQGLGRHIDQHTDLDAAGLDLDQPLAILHQQIRRVDRGDHRNDAASSDRQAQLADALRWFVDASPT